MYHTGPGVSERIELVNAVTSRPLEKNYVPKTVTIGCRACTLLCRYDARAGVLVCMFPPDLWLAVCVFLSA